MPIQAFQSTAFLERLSSTRLAPWRAGLERAIAERLGTGIHGDLAAWEAALAALPELPPGRPVVDEAEVGVEPERPLSADEHAALRSTLMALHPWRKGPYSIHGLVIDSEWRSDWKWERLAEGISPLTCRLVLDVGCGNGYHAWRMLGAGAELVLGIDPTLLYTVQFRAIRHYLPTDRIAVLPIAIEDMISAAPAAPTGFDTCFSMGVLYHRRSPIDHLLELRGLLRPGGELVLETLILDGRGERCLVPPGRYAGMRNCWFIPSVDALRIWLARSGFQQIQVLDRSPTTTEEQRGTDWMHFHSLAEQLDPADPSRTREGHPAPVRAILTARVPG